MNFTCFLNKYLDVSTLTRVIINKEKFTSPPKIMALTTVQIIDDNIIKVMA